MGTRWRVAGVAAAAAWMLATGPGRSLAQGRQPERAAALFQSGVQALQTEQFEAARDFFTAAIAADPLAPEPRCGLGQAQMVLRRYPEAVQAYEKCKELTLAARRRLQSVQAKSYAQIENEIRELKDGIQRIQTGQVKSKTEHDVVRLEQAIRDLERQRSREPVRVEVPAEVTFALGNACLRAGEYAKAEREMREALQARPGAGEIHNNLAVVYVSMGRFDEAAEQVARAEEAGFQVSPELKADVAARHASAPAIPAPRPEAEAATPAEAGAEPAVTLEHEARHCAVRDRFVRIRSTLRPLTAAGTPKVRFRTGDGEWYTEGMSPDESGTFTALLPRPTHAKQFTYSIEVDGADPPVRTGEYVVPVNKDAARCPEAAEDPQKVETVLVVEPPGGEKSPAPVPSGFSIRGTTADIGVLELGSSKALVAGLLVGGGAVAGGIALATAKDKGFQGPQPFEDGPGIRLVDSNPPSGSTLSLKGTPLTVQLALYSPDAIPNAQVVMEVAHDGYSSACFTFTASADLPAGRTVTVPVSGIVHRMGTCIPGAPLSVLRVAVSDARGFGGFRTGLPPLLHIRVEYNLEE